MTVRAHNKSVAIVPIRRKRTIHQLAVDPGIRWNGKKPKGIARPESLPKGVSVSDWVIEDLRWYLDTSALVNESRVLGEATPFEPVVQAHWPVDAGRGSHAVVRSGRRGDCHRVVAPDPHTSACPLLTAV